MLNVLLNRVSITKDNKERIILNDIVFELESGKIYTILGKNGTGKSTLLKSLTGLLDDRFYSVNGKVIYNDKDVLKLDENELQKIRENEIKYIFQDPVNSFDHLKTFGYYFNKLTPLSLTRRGAGGKVENEVDELLEFFILPDSKTLFKMYPYEVSGGMAQRISFILALLAKPKIIFLDEPTSGIDAPIVNLLLIKLREFINEGNLALMVTQDIELAKNASSKIALLSNNTLSKFTSPEEFFYLNPLRTEI
ncbi:MAG: ATP-binding cassette domain-containing protein [Ignavibacteria bacterium]|nr:ATP-binding cassette domain-containing protein [Ignavibacteria bacterium]